MRHARPPALEPLADDELVELEHALEQLARGSSTVPGGTVARPWEAGRGVRSLELVTELRTTGARQSRMGAGGGAAAPAHERPLPYVESANDLAEQLHGTVAALAVALMRVDANVVGPVRQGPATLHAEDLATWLLGRLDSLAWRPGLVRPHLAELARLVAKGRAAVDRRAARWYAGPCNLALRDDAGDLVIVNGHQARCHEDLYVRPHVNVAICRACHGEHHIKERRAELLRQARNRLETATDLSRALSAIGNLECRPERVRQWAKRGRITVRGHDAAGHPLYRVGDAIDLLTADADRAERAAKKAAASKPANEAKRAARVVELARATRKAQSA